MSWLVWIFLESPAALGLVIFLVAFCLLVYWRRGGSGRPLAVSLAVAVGLLVLQALAVTRREHAQRALSMIERDVLRARTEGLEAVLAPDFATQGLDRWEFLDLVNRQYERVQIRDVDRGALRLSESAGDEFTIEVSYQAEVRFSEYAGPVHSRWRMRFVRTEVGWRVAEIVPLSISGVGSPTWSEIRRGG